jgi:hypothetical protein
VPGLLIRADFGSRVRQATQPGGMAVGEFERNLDPFPALGAEGLGLGSELGDRQTIKQGQILQPPAIVLLEQVTHDDAARRLVGGDADEACALVGSADRALGQLAADVIGFLVVGAGQALPDLLLPRLVVGDSEGHELLKRHLVVGVEVEELRGDGDELEPLLHHVRADEEAGGDVFFAEPGVAQGLEGAELVERMQRGALNVLGQAVLLGDAVLAHDAGHRLSLGHALLLDEELKGAEATPARRDLIDAGVGVAGVAHRPDAQGLQEPAPGDVLSQFLDRQSGLDAPDIGLGQGQLVEGNVLRPAQDDGRLGFCHGGVLRDGRPELSLSLQTRHPNPSAPSL